MTPESLVRHAAGADGADLLVTTVAAPRWASTT